MSETPSPRCPGTADGPTARKCFPHPDSTPASEGALAAYLDELCAPLAGLAPEAWQADLRAELASHLEALIEAHEELGASRAEAVRYAFRQMGSPRRLGKQWARRWRARRPQAALWAAVKLTLTCFVPATGLAIAATAPMIQQPISQNDPWAAILTGLPIYVAPLVAGVLSGWHCRGRRVMGPLVALLLLPMLTWVAGQAFGWQRAPDGLCFFPLIQLFIWLPLGWLSSVVTTCVRDWVLPRWVGDRLNPA